MAKPIRRKSRSGMALTSLPCFVGRRLTASTCPIIECPSRSPLRSSTPSPWGAWDWATAAEAHIARGCWDDAEQAIKNYVAASDRDPFKLAGTLRQLEQVWNLGLLNQKGQEIMSVQRQIAETRQWPTFL
jgi:hypothetical protein